ncbi:MAG: hypothetical protein WAK17_21955 [Candidatus Nitrosopolaris sp.]
MVDVLSQYCGGISDEAYLRSQVWNFGPYIYWRRIGWHVFVRIIPNEDGSTVTWTFVKPDGNFDSETSNWKSTLEGNEK